MEGARGVSTLAGKQLGAPGLPHCWCSPCSLGAGLPARIGGQRHDVQDARAPPARCCAGQQQQPCACRRPPTARTCPLLCSAVKQRMKSVANIQKITKAMKMVAASKMRSAQVRRRGAGAQHPQLLLLPAAARCAGYAVLQRAAAYAVLHLFALQHLASGTPLWRTALCAGQHGELAGHCAAAGAPAGRPAVGGGRQECGGARHLRQGPVRRHQHRGVQVSSAGDRCCRVGAAGWCGMRKKCRQEGGVCALLGCWAAQPFEAAAAGARQLGCSWAQCCANMVAAAACAPAQPLQPCTACALLAAGAVAAAFGGSTAATAAAGVSPGRCWDVAGHHVDTAAPNRAATAKCACC